MVYLPRGSMKFNYQDSSLKSGIYKIINTHTNRIYIGQAQCFKKRWNGHKCSLIKDKHQNKFLLNDFNKCQLQLGHTDFLEFHVLEVMEDSTKEERNAKEEHWVSKHWDNRDRCYNFKQKPAANERTHYSSTPAETRSKKSASMAKVWQDPEFRADVSAKHKEFWNTEDGKRMASERIKTLWTDPDHQKAMSERMTARMRVPEHKAKATSNLNTEKSITKRSQTYRNRLEAEPEFRVKMQAHGKKNIAKRNAEQPVKTYGSIISPDGIVYPNISHVPTFAKEHGLQKQNLYLLLHGKIKSHKDWKLISNL